jgi:hypothetical protein
MADTAYACLDDARALGVRLTIAAGHAEDAETVISRQARYGAGGRGGTSDGQTYDETRSVRLNAVRFAVDGWVSDLHADAPLPAWRRTQGPLCPPLRTGVTLDDGEVMFVRCPHSSCAAIRVLTPPTTLARELQWLSGQMGALRKHPAAGEAFRELHDACDDLARLVDIAPANELVGMCDCGRTLYAPHGRTVVQCPERTCKLKWDVAESRDILRKALDEKLVTASEAARLSGFLDSDRTQEQIRKLIDKWAGRTLIEAHGHVDEADGVDEDGLPKTRTVPTFRFGDISGRLARTPRRTAVDRPWLRQEKMTA